MPHKCADCGTVHPDNSDSILNGCEECGGNRFQFIHREPIELDTTVDFDDPDDEETADADADKEELIEEFLERKEDEEDATVVETEPVDEETANEDEDSSGGATEVRRSSKGLGSDADGVRRIRNERPDIDTSDDEAEETEPSPAETDDQPAETRADADDSPAEEDPVEADAPEPADTEPVDAARANEPEPATAESADGDATGEAPKAPGYELLTDVEEVKNELNRQFESIKVLEPGKYALNPMAMYENEEFVVALEEDGQYRIEPVSRYGDNK